MLNYEIGWNRRLVSTKSISNVFFTCIFLFTQNIRSFTKRCVFFLHVNNLGIKRKSVLMTNNHGSRRLSIAFSADLWIHQRKVLTLERNILMWIWLEVNWATINYLIYWFFHVFIFDVILTPNSLLYIHTLRLNISESQAKAEPIDCITIGRTSLPVFAFICNMVGGPNIIANIRISIHFVCNANAELGHLQFQCAQIAKQSQRIGYMQCRWKIRWKITGKWIYFGDWIGGADVTEFTA